MQFNLFADKDDLYFIRAAQMMLDGDWLGDYTQMTLIKGPGFAYFLALNHVLGTSITLSLTLVFIGSCALFVRVVSRRLPLTQWVAFALFASLLFQPALMPTRILRDHLYHSLFLVVLASMITLTIGPHGRGWVWRSFFLGLPIGLFWITREEGIWVLPAFGVLLAARVWHDRSHVRTALLPLAGALVALALGAAVPILGTSAINQSVYGTFAVTDLNASPFQSALRALDSISTDQEVPHVLVSRTSLRAAYAVSPALAELRETLDSPDNFWLAPGCAIYPDTCGEYGGGWFGWAVRDAAFAAGRYSTATEASEFYTRIASEVDDACNRKKLACASGVVPVGPIVSAETIRDLPATMFRAVRLTAYGDGAVPVVVTTVGDPVPVDATRQFLGDPTITSSVSGPAALAPENSWVSVHIKNALGQVYAVATPVALVLGILTFVIASVLALSRRPVRRRVLVVAGVCWVLWLCRLGLVSLIDLTSSPAVVTDYLEPAFLALWIAAFLSIVAAVPFVRTALSRAGGRPNSRGMVSQRSMRGR